MLYLISYDIVDDKKRNRLHKLLKNYGQRTQYSMFECNIDEKKYVDLIYKINKIKIESGDSIMVYPICSTCSNKITRKGSFVPLDVYKLIF